MSTVPRSFVRPCVLPTSTRTIAVLLAGVLASPILPVSGWAADAVSIEHDEVACLVAGAYPRMDACVAPPDRVGRAQVQFRANDSGPWYAVDLVPGQSCLSAVLPKPLATTRTVEYFVNVVDRKFAEARRPERAPDTPYHARVVAREADCHEMRKAGAFLMRASGPITIMAVRDASGHVLESAAAQALGAATPAGFSPEGVTVSMAPRSGPGAAPAAAAAAGHGLPLAVLVGGGAAVLAGGIAVATKGGDDGSTTSSGSPSLSGRWVGPTNRVVSSNGTVVTTCTEEFTLDAQQSGTSLAGTLTVGTGTCTATVAPGLPPITTSAPGGSAPIAGTVTGGQVQFTFTSTPNCPPVQFTGTLGGNTLAGTFRSSCATVTETTTWTAQRR